MYREVFSWLMLASCWRWNVSLCSAFSLLPTAPTSAVPSTRCQSFALNCYLNDMPFYRSKRNGLVLSMSSSEVDVSADDVESIHSLFLKHCDTEGLMTKDDLKAVPEIDTLLKDGDLLSSELDNIWNSAPKFPLNEDVDKIDVDSFTQIYRDIDDLFEDDEDGELDNTTEAVSSSSNPPESVSISSDGIPVKAATNLSNVSSESDKDEGELEDVFRSICDSSNLISRENLFEWDEVKQLISDNLLDETEFNSIFDKTMKSPGTDNMLDVEGFLSFNVYLDDLFDFDDEEEETTDTIQSVPSKSIVNEEGLPAGVLFAELAGADLLVGWNDLKRWGELRQMISEGDLLPSELESMFASIPKSQKSPGKIDEEGFCQLHQSVFDLFEDDDEEGIEIQSSNITNSGTSATSPKAELYRIIDEIESQGGLSGLECSEKDDTRILDMVKQVERLSDNLVKQREIKKSDISGKWKLLYTSSGMFKFNRGLTGLAGSVPNADFGGLKQVIKADDYFSDLECIEKIAVKGSEDSSFDAKVNGDWELKTSVSLFTGEPTVIMSVEPDKVTYGPTNTRADHWKSVRSMNLLDISYLDDDLRIMRGNTSTDTVFIFKRI